MPNGPGTSLKQLHFTHIFAYYSIELKKKKTKYETKTKSEIKSITQVSEMDF